MLEDEVVVVDETEVVVVVVDETEVVVVVVVIVAVVVVVVVIVVVVVLLTHDLGATTFDCYHILHGLTTSSMKHFSSAFDAAATTISCSWPTGFGSAPRHPS